LSLLYHEWQAWFSLEFIYLDIKYLVAVYILNFITYELLYRIGYFYLSFKAFLFLEKFSPSDKYSKGKVSSAIRFYLLFSEKISSDILQEIIHYLWDGPQSLEVNKSLKMFKTLGKGNGMDFTDEPVLDEA